MSFTSSEISETVTFQRALARVAFLVRLQKKRIFIQADKIFQQSIVTYMSLCDHPSPSGSLQQIEFGRLKNGTPRIL
jgi:hypothetical protein